jgi:hypothetical protein
MVAISVARGVKWEEELGEAMRKIQINKLIADS